MSDLDEWRDAVNELTEQDRYINTNAHRWALGLIGDKEDDLNHP